MIVSPECAGIFPVYESFVSMDLAQSNKMSPDFMFEMSNFCFYTSVNVVFID